MYNFFMQCNLAHNQYMTKVKNNIQVQGGGYLLQIRNSCIYRSLPLQNICQLQYCKYPRVLSLSRKGQKYILYYRTIASLILMNMSIYRLVPEILLHISLCTSTSTVHSIISVVYPNTKC